MNTSPHPTLSKIFPRNIMPIATLPADAISCIMERVQSDDLLPAALACTAFSVECIQRADSTRKDGEPRWITEATSSFDRMQWAIHVMGATPIVKWCAVVAQRNDETLLCFLHYKYKIPWDASVCAAAAAGGGAAAWGGARATAAAALEAQAPCRCPPWLWPTLQEAQVAPILVFLVS